MKLLATFSNIMGMSNGMLYQYLTFQKLEWVK